MAYKALPCKLPYTSELAGDPLLRQLRPFTSESKPTGLAIPNAMPAPHRSGRSIPRQQSSCQLCHSPSVTEDRQPTSSLATLTTKAPIRQSKCSLFACCVPLVEVADGSISIVIICTPIVALYPFPMSMSTHLRDGQTAEINFNSFFPSSPSFLPSPPFLPSCSSKRSEIVSPLSLALSSTYRL